MHGMRAKSTLIYEMWLIRVKGMADLRKQRLSHKLCPNNAAGPSYFRLLLAKEVDYAGFA